MLHYTVSAALLVTLGLSTEASDRFLMREPPNLRVRSASSWSFAIHDREKPNSSASPRSVAGG